MSDIIECLLKVESTNNNGYIIECLLKVKSTKNNGFHIFSGYPVENSVILIVTILSFYFLNDEVNFNVIDINCNLLHRVVVKM